MNDTIYYKVPNILSLSGITLQDYISFEDAADERLLENDKINNEDICMYNKIPNIFTGLSTWPVSTNLLCWSCGFKFDTVPKFIPTYIREINDITEVGVMGNMCSFNCAELWILTHTHNREERFKLQNNLCYLYFLFTGKRIASIKPALCKTNLLQYGGTMNEETFLKNTKDLEKDI
jgi:hypothetical protein